MPVLLYINIDWPDLYNKKTAEKQAFDKLSKKQMAYTFRYIIISNA